MLAGSDYTYCEFVVFGYLYIVPVSHAELLPAQVNFLSPAGYRVATDESLVLGYQCWAILSHAVGERPQGARPVGHGVVPSIQGIYVGVGIQRAAAAQLKRVRLARE